ncbi:MAG: hypothetical protein ACE5D8_09310 [Fidelibacterota bacterium]
MKKTILILIVFFLQLNAQDGRSVKGSVGAVTIDGKIWNQIALRPVIPVGKFGVALDLIIYMDDQGNIRKDEWDFSNPEAGFNTLVDKIYYIRYGHPSDPLYARLGALDNVTLGYGILLSGYANTMEYPQEKKVGLDLRIRRSRLAVQGMTSDINELGGLVGVRFESPLLFGIPMGIALVADRNQYLGLKDQDNDGYPDWVDDFPDNKRLYRDTDGDGLSDFDPAELDIDGDGITDTLDSRIPGWTMDPFVLDTDIFKKSDPINVNRQSNAVAAIALDAGLPVFDDKHFSLRIYVQAAQLIGTTIDPATGNDQALGLGLVPLGLWAKFGPARLNLEYRTTPTGRFEFGYWNRAYDLERAIFVQTSAGSAQIQTKEAGLGIYGNSSGVYSRLQVNVGPLFKVTAQYQTLSGEVWNVAQGDFEKTQYQNFFAEAGLLKSISKLKYATLFLQQRNVPNIFQYEPNESTLQGYKIGLEMGGGVILNYVYRKTFRDLNGDGDVRDRDETINTTSIETSFAF